MGGQIGLGIQVVSSKLHNKMCVGVYLCAMYAHVHAGACAHVCDVYVGRICIRRVYVRACRCLARVCDEYVVSIHM